MNKEYGIRRTDDGGIFCEKCGADLSKPNSAKFVGHIDGTKFYQNNFECVKCGAVMAQVCERDAEDAKWWAE